ncbi:DUF1249 domain-containing protein [Natronocella acetinitrilica]|jgi:uncharacterized protein|nr:DUF1249 domain-containing protein [Natronocella acetinitrilica]
MLSLRDHPLLDRIPSRSFATLMELYEGNYILMRRLAPSLRHLQDSNISRVDGTVDLHLRVHERSPYTTTVSMTHYFDLEEGAVEPDLLLRVYHDARVAEVMPETPVERFRLWNGDQPDPRSLEWRWEMNRFLNRWLRYCLGEGHRFAGCESQLASAAGVQR